MRFYFVRHGESEANVQRVIVNRGEGYPLTEKGRAQASALAEQLQDAGITRSYSSPLLRAMQTAEILSARLGVGFEITDALREFDCGVLEGSKADPASWANHDEVWRAWIERGQYDSRIEGGESFLDLRARFEPFLARLLAELSADDRVVLVGHGGLYLSMLPLALENVDFAHAARLSFPNAAYVVAEPRPDGLRCLEWCGMADWREL